MTLKLSSLDQEILDFVKCFDGKETSPGVIIASEIERGHAMADIRESIRFLMEQNYISKAALNTGFKRGPNFPA